MDTINNAMGKRSRMAMDHRQRFIGDAMRNYSAKRAAAGQDIGKPNVPGKAGFNAVEQKAAAKYGSEEAGKRVAGAVLNRLRHRGG